MSRRRDEETTSRLSSWAAELFRRLVGGGGEAVARVEWCRAQRQNLGTPGHFVVWVRGDTMPWALWGAQRGYFELERMDGLTYLRAPRAG